MARRKFDEHLENHDRWLISYADLITLLFAFFVVMYAISVVNVSKYKVFSAAIGDAFNDKDKVSGFDTVQPMFPLPHSPADALQRRRTAALAKERQALTRLASNLAATLAPLVREGKVRVTQSSRGVSVEINASVLFDPGDATLMPESRAALAALAVLLRDDHHAVQVEGHTDITPIGNRLFPSNWELSAVRASSVVRLFIEHGVAAKRLTAVGHGANLPVASNDTPEGKARNRRVAVTILSALPDATTEIAPNTPPQR